LPTPPTTFISGSSFPIHPRLLYLQIGPGFFRECVAGSRTHLWNTPFATVLDEWQEFKVVAQGDTFDCYFDGELKTTVTSDRFKSGPVGVFAWDQARFDDFEVTGPGIPHRVEGDGKLTATWGMIKAVR